MKKIHLFCILACSSLAFSQSSLHFTGNVGYSYRPYDATQFNTFVTSFNSYYTNVLTTPLEAFDNNNKSYYVGLGGIVKMNKFVTSFMVDRVEYNQFRTAAFNNDYNYDFNLYFRTYHFNIDLSYAPSKYVEFGLQTGASIVSSSMSVTGWMYSRDNYTHDYQFAALNGIYRSGLQTSLNLGLNARINVTKFVSIQLRAYRMVNFLSDPASEYLFAYEDSSPGKILGSIFPNNMEQYYENINNQVYEFEENVITPKGLNWCMEAGIIIKLGKTFE
jgi:hypothetical protein